METKSVGTNLNKISTILCCGDNEYKAIKGTERFDFSIKSGLGIKEQNDLGKMLQEVIFTLNNLSEENRNNLKYIERNSVQCQCGTVIPTYLNYCPKCFKMIDETGRLVDSIKCNFCGQRIPVNKKFCKYCGSKIGINIGNEKEVEQPKENEQKFCMGCGNPIRFGDKFCNQCGLPTNKEEIHTYCPNCGNVIVGKKKFCSRCGIQLIKEVAK